MSRRGVKRYAASAERLAQCILVAKTGVAQNSKKCVDTERVIGYCLGVEVTGMANRDKLTDAANAILEVRADLEKETEEEYKRKALEKQIHTLLGRVETLKNEEARHLRQILDLRSERDALFRENSMLRGHYLGLGHLPSLDAEPSDDELGAEMQRAFYFNQSVAPAWTITAPVVREHYIKMAKQIRAFQAKAPVAELTDDELGRKMRHEAYKIVFEDHVGWDELHPGLKEAWAKAAKNVRAFRGGR